MKVRALTSFCGKINMAQNEIRDLKNQELIDDLAKAGYIEILENKSKKFTKKNSEEVQKQDVAKSEENVKKDSEEVQKEDVVKSEEKVVSEE